MTVHVSPPASGGGGVAVDAGTYSPTLSIVSGNLSTVDAAAPFTWSQVGDVVTVAGVIDVVPSGLSAANEIDVSIPVASGSLASLAGTCAGNTLPGSTDALEMAGVVVSSGTAARAKFTTAYNNAPGAFTFSVVFQYLVTP